MARNKWGTAIAIAVGLLTMAVGLTAAPAAAATAEPVTVGYSSSATPLTIQSSTYGDVTSARGYGPRSGAWASLADTEWTHAGGYCDGSSGYWYTYWYYDYYWGGWYPYSYWVGGSPTTCSYTFTVDVPTDATNARFAGQALSDNEGWLVVDGSSLASTGDYSGSGGAFDLALAPGQHVVTFNVTDHGGPSGLIFDADLTYVPAQLDADDDGVADDQDAFPNDPSESADTDGDGVGDNGDAFPADAAETADADDDGTGDNADAFDDDPTETTDTDGDGVGDNGDAFPTDATESADADGDGTGDNADVLDDDPSVGAVQLTAAGVCDVVKSFVTKAGVANSLCVKLAAGSFGAFGNELRAQTGKAITAQNATSLRNLVGLID